MHTVLHIDTVVVTGGLVDDPRGNEWGVITSRVQVYDSNGPRENGALPNMNKARQFHACGFYIKENKVVNSLHNRVAVGGHIPC